MRTEARRGTANSFLRIGPPARLAVRPLQCGMASQGSGGATLRQHGEDMGHAEQSRVPLCVDLDGTLLRTDVLWESVIQLWRRPLVAWRAILALVMHGKAAFKSVLAYEIAIDPATLPYRDEVLNFVRQEHATGRDVVLVTATHRVVAQSVADHVRVFCRVFATEEGVNLSHVQKQARLVAAYGARGFDYIGDHAKDLPALAAARNAMLVAPSRALLEKASASANLSRVFSGKPVDLRVLAKALRLHQWSKNILLAVPLLAAHRISDLQGWISVAIAFCGFGFVASATYLINDLVDLRSDRTHASKRFRPLASGELAIPAALALAIALGVLGFVVSVAFLPGAFVAYLALYVVLTLGYSLDLKRRLLIDVLALALLYTLRVLAGGAAVTVVVSEWLSMFCLFMFLSLAFLKRAIELQGAQGTARISGRGYMPTDLETVRILGVSSGLLSVLVLALYAASPAVSQLYRSPHVLWLICPLLIYWIARIWFLAAREEVHHDPLVFALLDWRSYVLGACALAAVLVARIGVPALAS
jgi:4-hydroxybenzoate polyprenyltransferase/phosphoserine phosphatase